MEESSRVEKPPLEDVIWWEALESNIHGTYEGNAKDAYNVWPYPRSWFEDVEDWRANPYEVEEDGEVTMLF